MLLTLSYFTDAKNEDKSLITEKVRKSIYTTAAKANAGGNAQANIIIIPNCNANSKKSALKLETISKFNEALVLWSFKTTTNEAFQFPVVVLYVSEVNIMKYKSLMNLKVPSNSPSSSSSPMLAE